MGGSQTLPPPPFRVVVPNQVQPNRLREHFEGGRTGPNSRWGAMTSLVYFASKRGGDDEATQQETESTLISGCPNFALSLAMIMSQAGSFCATPTLKGDKAFCGQKKVGRTGSSRPVVYEEKWSLWERGETSRQLLVPTSPG